MCACVCVQIEGKRMSESSIEELISPCVMPRFRGDTITFSSAGREGNESQKAIEISGGEGREGVFLSPPFSTLMVCV